MKDGESKINLLNVRNLKLIIYIKFYKLILVHKQKWSVHRLSVGFTFHSVCGNCGPLLSYLFIFGFSHIVV
jgi:hypothetical protein